MDTFVIGGSGCELPVQRLGIDEGWDYADALNGYNASFDADYDGNFQCLRILDRDDHRSHVLARGSEGWAWDGKPAEGLETEADPTDTALWAGRKTQEEKGRRNGRQVDGLNWWMSRVRLLNDRFADIDWQLMDEADEAYDDASAPAYRTYETTDGSEGLLRWESDGDDAFIAFHEHCGGDWNAGHYRRRRNETDEALSERIGGSLQKMLEHGDDDGEGTWSE